MRSTSADAANCYDQINHITMAFLLFAVTGWAGAIVSLIIPIQTIKFYRTRLGDSTTLMGGGGALCHGPVRWTMIAAVLMYYKHQGFGAKIVMPITGWIIYFLGTMFVDDIDLNVMGDNLQTSEQVFQEM